MSNKILTGIFIVLFVVLIGEVGYFFYSTNKKPQVIENVSTPSPEPTKIISKLVNPEYIKMLAEVEKTPNVKYFLTEEKIGFISEIDFTPYENQGYKFIAKLTISDKDGNPVQPFGFTEGRLKHFNFYKEIDGKKEKITIKDIKTGQKAKFIAVVDLTEKDINKDVVSNEIIISE